MSALRSVSCATFFISLLKFTQANTALTLKNEPVPAETPESTFTGPDGYSQRNVIPKEEQICSNREAFSR